eukprot:GHVQ01020096.1.p1 GENE.GHVQ01020096.1~~GHVQ01020096.1.p1  ORF type:complete len:173 (+),score=22.47 GHVQ01020096.1:215-733(+)
MRFRLFHCPMGSSESKSGTRSHELHSRAHRNFASAADETLLKQLGEDVGNPSTSQTCTVAQEEWKLEEDSRCLSQDVCDKLRTSSDLFQSNRWTRMYASWNSGRSFNRCANSIMGYPGLTVVVIKATGGEVFGAVCRGQWKESSHQYFGTSSCFLFSTIPEFKIFRYGVTSE